MFTYRLTRLPFAVLIFAHEFWAIAMINSNTPLNWLLVLVSIPVVLVAVILPRVRDCDWPLWVGLLTMIPYIGSITGIALLFAGTKVFNRHDDPTHSGEGSQNGPDHPAD